MKKFVYILVVSFLFIYACSTKKNTFVSRNFHGLTAKYNVLYNGKIALDKGIVDLANQYEDNYWEILPIEPLHLNEEEIIKVQGETENSEEGTKTSFDIAEEKAVKSIQKHGMNIRGKEYNRQTDEAYLLLGKARYYSQRFVPALEAFDFLLKNFQTDDLTHELNIWKAKTQIRLQNEERAVKTLNNLLTYKELDEETKEKAHTAIAMAYMAIDSVPLAIEQLEKAVVTQNDKNQYARNLIILGQLYRQENKIDSSQIALKKVLAFKKSPYKYKMHAYIEQAKNINDTLDYKELQLQFAQLIKAYENKDYLDEFYYQMALMDFRDGNDSLALNKLNKSIHTPNAKSYQMGLSYEKAGDYYFDKAQFVKAGSFYDSLMATVENENTKRIRKLKRKRKSLDEVITYESTLKHNDSVLGLVAMSESERREFFGKYVAELERLDKIAAIVKENQERALSSSGGGVLNSGEKIGGIKGKWYFYNAQAVGFGKAGFTRIWGNRKLADNWRLTQRTGTNDTEIATRSGQSDESSNLKESEKYDVDFYLSQIPTDEKVIQEMNDDNSHALYQLGLIYKEKFQEYELAINRLERFLVEKPKEKLILPAKYHLYRTYEITGNAKLGAMKQDILANYPESRFSEIIQNPEEVQNPNTKKAPEVHYEKVYCDYEYERYQSTLEQCETAIKQYVDDPIQAKFELLKSYAIYKIEGKDPFKKELDYIVVNYPKTEEAEHAQDVLDFLNGVKKTEKKETKNSIKLSGNKKNSKKISAERPANRGQNTEGNRSQSQRRRSSSNTNENRGGNRSNRGSNNTPPNNNNQNNDRLGDK